LRRDYLFPDHEATFTILADRDRAGPWGLFGGQAGERAVYVLNPDGESRRLGSKVTLELKPGDVVSYQTCGGGGYGPPHERDPRMVLHDVRTGKVNLARARDVFRVAIDTGAWRVLEEETAKLRLSHLTAHLSVGWQDGKTCLLRKRPILNTFVAQFIRHHQGALWY
jgi:N-methylhydantoinase B